MLYIKTEYASDPFLTELEEIERSEEGDSVRISTQVLCVSDTESSPSSN